MKEVKIGGKDYKIEFSFGAVEDGKLVKDMFNMLSGAYIAKQTDTKGDLEAMLDGTSEMMADVPRIAVLAFKTGLLENHSDLPDDERKELAKQYVKENKLTMLKLYEEMRDCMEEDGFFTLSGIKEMIQRITEQTEETMPINLQDHKKKQTSKK